ncbi:MAG: alpha/beta fold hydrolase [Planctomycetota bacterium]|nr:alpha/beta fold hydrolase [Planctomycetota bacterium]
MRRLALTALVAAAVIWSATATAQDPGRTADAVVKAFDAKKPLPRAAKLDPWLVADELLARGRPKAALAWARASNDRSLVRAVQQTARPDRAARTAFKKAGSDATALAKIRTTEPILALRIARARAEALRRSERSDDARAAYRKASGTAKKLGWRRLAGKTKFEEVRLAVAELDKVAARAANDELRVLATEAPDDEEIAQLRRDAQQIIEMSEMTPRTTDHGSDVPDLADPGADGERLVRVYFATDRAEFAPDRAWTMRRFRWAALALLAVFLLPLVFRKGLRKWVLVALAIAWISYTAVTAVQTMQVWDEYRRLGMSYGTDRSRNENVRTRGYDLGICDVSIPPGHAPGEIERPEIWHAEVLPNLDEDIMMVRLERRDAAEFFGEVKNRVDDSETKRAFVFVHGYNVEFREAVWRTAQIAWDVQFDGPAILYSWPSQGEIPMYEADKGHARWAVRHLAAFLTDLRAKTGATSIHLVGHSMGGYVLTEALDRLAMKGTEHTAVFKNVILAAPDIDADIFQQYIAPALVNARHQVTLYASKNDYALVASRNLRGNIQVAGEVRDGRVVTVPGMDTIDVSDVSGGHSYIGNNNHVLHDFKALLRGAKAAAERAAESGLLRRVKNAWWKLSAARAPR